MSTENAITSSQAPSQAPAQPDEFVISRVLHGTPQQVFDAFTQPEQLSQWWGPWMVDHCDVSVDPKAGGLHSIAMTAPDGARYVVKGEFLEVQAPHKLIMTMDCTDHPAAWQDLVDPARGSNPNPAGVAVLTVWIEPEPAPEPGRIGDPAAPRTRLTVRQRFECVSVRDALVRMGMPDGWSESLEKLDELVQGILPRAVFITRLYAHPLDQVFAAFTTAEALALWWGPNRFSITTERFDFRVGGIWQFVMHGPDGTNYDNKILFTPIEPQRRIGHLHGDGNMGDDGSGAMFEASIRMATFGGMTRVTNHLVFPNRQARDATVRAANAMEGGRQTLARLEAFLQGKPTQNAIV